MNPPLVSILIPCHNAAPWLAQTLESALAQTWAHREIIVIDDGSDDDSPAIMRGFEARGVQMAGQANRGAAAARNHGLRLARGQLIQFLDADDLLTPDKIAAQVEVLERAGPDSVATCRWGRFTGDPAATAFVDDAVFRDFAPADFLVEHTGRARMMHPAAWLMPRDLADRAGPWDESLSLNDDGEYFARVTLAARRIVFSAVGASLYRSDLRGSLSRRRDRRALESAARSMKLIATHLSRAEDSPRVRRALADYWQRFIYDIYPAAPDLRRSAEAEVRAFGGSHLKPEMGARERFVARLVGWKAARRLRGRPSS
ncbi:MAG: glycosyltransferase family 2 protein [Opitutaceae bacterium]|jgi:glycosyltransferase involved in cell wall biosynthesis